MSRGFSLGRAAEFRGGTRTASGFNLLGVKSDAIKTILWDSVRGRSSVIALPRFPQCLCVPSVIFWDLSVDYPTSVEYSRAATDAGA